MPPTKRAMHPIRQVRPLVERARAGDRDAFDELVRLHFTPIYSMLHRHVGNHEDAEDLAQECFVRAWRSLSMYRHEGSFLGWLSRIALHLARDHHRGASRGLRLASGTCELDSLPLARAEAPGDASGQRELGLRLGEALRRLPERLRAALVLRVLEGRDYDEVGEALGVTRATARTHVMQARQRLVRRLGPWLDPDHGERGGASREERR